MASVTKSYRIRAYPNGAQRRMLDNWFGAARWVWNSALDIRAGAYRVLKLRLNSNDISRWLTQWKQTPGHEWLADVPATVLTQTLRDLEQAFRNFFGLKKDGGKYKKRARYPRPKKFGAKNSLRFQDLGKAWERGVLSLARLGPLKLAEGLPRKGDGFVEVPDSVTLTRDGAGRYHVSFKVVEEVQPLPVTGKTCGVDLGIKELAVIHWSDNTVEHVPAPKRYFAKQRYLRRQQRKLSRRTGAKKGEKKSSRYLKQKAQVAKAHAAVAAQREYALHQVTTDLIRRADIIGIEDLNVAAMARGMHAKSIHDAAFSEFRRQLEYKGKWYGRTIVAVDRFFPSSKLCSTPGCGHVHKGLKLGDRDWTCPKCGTWHDRDPTAAQNIHAEALRMVAGGDIWTAPAMQARRRLWIQGSDCDDISGLVVRPSTRALMTDSLAGAS